MLRPATPLTILFFVAFVLLLLGTISVPIVKSIPLSTYDLQDGGRYAFGVFGWCGPVSCSDITVGYSTADLPGLSGNGDFSLPSSTRNSLTSILVVHPVAALMALICAALAGALHLHSPAHSPRYLLFLLIFSFPTLLVALLAFLVDILVFVPHMAWGGWLMLVATLLITACSVLTCAMRRTLVSRKARKKRIAENADMNGANYYASKPTLTQDASLSASQSQHQYERAESPPPLENKALDGGVTGDRLPHFATYETSDDRVPLNQREPSIKTVSSNGPRAQPNAPVPDFTDSSRPLLPAGATAAANAYGNVAPKSPVSPMEREASPNSRDAYFAEGAMPQRRGGPSPNMYPRGRGGYPPPQRGGYPPQQRGGYPPQQRGGYGPPQRGGYVPRGGPGGPPPPGWNGRGGYGPRGGFRGGPNGMRGPPPPGWQGDGGPGPMGFESTGAGMVGGAMMGRGGRAGPPPGYRSDHFGGDGTAANYDGNGDSRQYGEQDGFQGAYDAQAVAYGSRPSMEQNRRTPPARRYEDQSRPAGAQPSRGFGDEQALPYAGPAAGPYARGASPARNVGVPRDASPPPPMPPVARDEPIGQAIEMDAMSGNPAQGSNNIAHPVTGFAQGHSPTHETGGTYSHSTMWQQQEPVEMGENSPIREKAAPVMAPPAGPVELASSTDEMRQDSKPAASDAYYEDVQPRFAQGEGVAPMKPAATMAPSTLIAGAGHTAWMPQPATPQRELSASSHYSESQTMRPGAHEDAVLRTRSPAHSDASNFTSISQRGVNPDWAPGAGDAAAAGWQGRGPYAARAPPPASRGIAPETLMDNPDFSVPGMASRGRGGMVRGSGRPYHHSRGSSGAGGRYPDAI